MFFQALKTPSCLEPCQALTSAAPSGREPVARFAVAAVAPSCVHTLCILLANWSVLAFINICQDKEEFEFYNKLAVERCSNHSFFSIQVLISSFQCKRHHTALVKKHFEQFSLLQVLQKENFIFPEM